MDEQKILQQLTEILKTNKDVNSQEIRQRLRAIALEKDYHSALRKFIGTNGALQKLKQEFDLTDKETQALTQSIKDNIAAYDEMGEKLRDAGSATIGFAKAVYKGEGTFSSITDVFSGKFGAVGDLISGFGSSLDVNVEIFRQLSQVGATFSGSLIQLRQNAAAAALPLDDFAKLVGENAQTLAALSGRATAGGEFIAGLSNALRLEAIPQLATLGFTVEEINETLLLNLERQRRTNTFDANATQANIQSAINFGKQLDRLAKLTGIQRADLAKEIEAQQTNARFQAFLQNQTDETRQRLETFAATVGQLAPGLAEGFQDLIANAGVPVTEAGLAVVQNVPQIRGVVSDLIAGVTSAEGALVATRDLSAASIDRFRSATVTGQVEFLNLQGEFINLGRRLLDVQSVLGEQGAEADKLTKGLTQFEDASKRAGAALQSLETGFLALVGDVIGDAGGALNTGLTGLSKNLLELPPAISGPLYALGKSIEFSLNLLRDTGPTYLAVRQGVRDGMATGGLMSQLRGGAGGFARSGGRLLGGIAGAGLMAGGAVTAAGAETDAGKFGGVAASALGGALTGASFGKILGLPGMAVGGGIGLLLGLLGMGLNQKNKEPEGRQFGGEMDIGKPYLVGEKGPEIVAPKVASTAVANTDLQKTFDTEALEAKMTTMVTELNAANKTLTNMVNGVNTLVAVESRALRAHEKNARKDPNQIGLV